VAWSSEHDARLLRRSDAHVHGLAAWGAHSGAIATGAAARDGAGTGGAAVGAAGRAVMMRRSGLGLALLIKIGGRHPGRISLGK